MYFLLDLFKQIDFILLNKRMHQNFQAFETVELKYSLVINLC